MEKSRINLNSLESKQNKELVIQILNYRGKFIFTFTKETSVYFVKDIVHGRKKASS